MPKLQDVQLSRSINNVRTTRNSIKSQISTSTRLTRSMTSNRSSRSIQLETPTRKTTPKRKLSKNRSIVNMDNSEKQMTELKVNQKKSPDQPKRFNDSNKVQLTPKKNWSTSFDKELSSKRFSKESIYSEFTDSDEFHEMIGLFNSPKPTPTKQAESQNQHETNNIHDSDKVKLTTTIDLANSSNDDIKQGSPVSKQVGSSDSPVKKSFVSVPPTPLSSAPKIQASPTSKTPLNTIKEIESIKHKNNVELSSSESQINKALVPQNHYEVQKTEKQMLYVEQNRTNQFQYLETLYNTYEEREVFSNVDLQIEYLQIFVQNLGAEQKLVEFYYEKIKNDHGKLFDPTLWKPFVRFVSNEFWFFFYHKSKLSPFTMSQRIAYVNDEILLLSEAAYDIIYQFGIQLSEHEQQIQQSLALTHE
ncbi:hypothetical protein BLOT_014984 [Blomia tropicalis]|nr:hypothetical protein BLOT_014984 [Blomia tropicalis]